MKMERFSPQTQDGLRLWCQEAHGAEPSWLDSLRHPQDWAWVYFLALASENRKDWFPHGKAAFLQHLQNLLLEEAGPLVGRPLIYGTSVEEASLYKHPAVEAGDAPHTVAAPVAGKSDAAV